MLKKCPLPTLVIGNSLTMNNDGHQGAKCPMQDTITNSATGGSNICLTAESNTDSSVSQTPYLEVTVSCFRNALRDLFYSKTNLQHKQVLAKYYLRVNAKEKSPSLNRYIVLIVVQLYCL